MHVRASTRLLCIRTYSHSVQWPSKQLLPTEAINDVGTRSYSAGSRHTSCTLEQSNFAVPTSESPRARRPIEVARLHVQGSLSSAPLARPCITSIGVQTLITGAQRRCHEFFICFAVLCVVSNVCLAHVAHTHAPVTKLCRLTCAPALHQILNCGS